jgi:hypothetical protein
MMNMMMTVMKMTLRLMREQGLKLAQNQARHKQTHTITHSRRPSSSSSSSSSRLLLVLQQAQQVAAGCQMPYRTLHVAQQQRTQRTVQ